MRSAAESKAWRQLKSAHQGQPAHPFPIGNDSFLDLAAPCIVVGGRNGAGKSRLLRRISEDLGAGALLLDLHHLCEQALMILRSRDDLDAMAEEYDALGPDADRLNDLKRVVGREYTTVRWFALEIEPSDETIAQRFRWSGDQSLVPYFRAEYRGVDYSSRNMGLGEFSVHFLFWILEQHREVEDLTLLLDEPDAFLPPVGISALLSRLLRLCLHRKWKIIVTTHSEEMISQAVEQQAFTLLRVDENGEAVAEHAVDDPSVGRTLLTRPPIEHVVFCEDESAWSLTRALIEHADPQLSYGTAVVWGSGNGYMNKILKHLPRPPRPDIRFAFAFDGDQRELVDPTTGPWPALFLPTSGDPDELFRTLARDPGRLAAKLDRPKEEVARFLDRIEGKDEHDWVNDLGREFGRAQILAGLAALWVEENPVEASQFVADLRTGWENG